MNKRLLRLVSGGLLYVLCGDAEAQRRDTASNLLPQHRASTDWLTPSNESVESELKAALAARKVPPDLSVSYNDMHGLWGGTSIVTRGSGIGELREKSKGEKKPKVVKKSVTQGQLLELVKLLVELRAWEQQTPDRPPVPDESRATLTISVGHQSSRLWERFNEMSQNNRLVTIKARMVDMTGGK